MLVTLPKELLTTTRKSAPESAVRAAGIVREAPVAPTMSMPFFVH